MRSLIRRIPSYLRTILRQRRRQDDDPRFLTHTVTFGCNARCVMCDSWKLPTRGDLTAEEIRAVYQQLPRMDAVRLTGGEPFARQDMLAIADSAVSELQPLVLHVTTNGFLTDRIVEFCEQRPRQVRLELLVSVDGVGDKHNEIRGHSRAYDLCLETLRALASRRGELNMQLTVNQTLVDAEGVDHYRRLRDVLRPLDIRNQVVMAYDVSATYSVEREINVAPREAGQFTTFGEFTEEHIQELLTALDEDIRTLPWLQRLAKRYYTAGIRNRLLGQNASPNPPCSALTSHLRLFPNGDVPTCQFNGQVVGNLRSHSYAELKEAALMRQQQAWVRDCPGCWAECEVLPNAVYSGDLLRFAIFGGGTAEAGANAVGTAQPTQPSPVGTTASSVVGESFSGSGNERNASAVGSPKSELLPILDQSADRFAG